MIPYPPRRRKVESAMVDDKRNPLHPFEWIDGLDPAIYLSIAQVFRQNLIAPDGFGSGKQERVKELYAIPFHDIKCLNRPFWTNGN